MSYEEQQARFHQEAEERDAMLHARRLEHEAASVGVTVQQLQRLHEANMTEDQQAARVREEREDRRTISHRKVKRAVKKLKDAVKRRVHRKPAKHH